MNRELQAAIERWEAEVGREAARLIREGTPPFQATEEARNIIQRRRRAKFIADQTTQHPLNRPKESP